jgi:hypothetical protein
MGGKQAAPHRDDLRGRRVLSKIEENPVSTGSGEHVTTATFWISALL